MASWAMAAAYIGGTAWSIYESNQAAEAAEKAREKRLNMLKERLEMQKESLSKQESKIQERKKNIRERAQQKRTGRRSTILTNPEDEEEAPTQQKTLLGE